jgi:hypothetical protein
MGVRAFRHNFQAAWNERLKIRETLLVFQSVLKAALQEPGLALLIR